ncbi:MAG: ATP-binding protein [Myxococcota bacterium]|nr:ATP-binding protein [Myxococcota bacterium]
MKMRDRLFIFSTVQLMVFGALFAVAYWQFSSAILPTFHRNLHEKSASVATAIGGQIDVALATDDADLAASTVLPYTRDPDFEHLLIRTQTGELLLERGRATSPAFTGPAGVAHRDGTAIETWLPVSLEGVELGAVSITFSTARIDAVGTWASWLALVVAAVWITALVYSMWFARSFVLPLRAMMRFSRRVAGGTLTERLAVDATDELRGLQEDLNSMASDLEGRELERQRRAREAEQLQQALLVMSRTAGMAEVATNVLHNVGNVLNSLNISVSVIVQHLNESKLRSLVKLVETFDQAPGGIVAFLGTEKGKLVPAYLSTLATRLGAEQAALLAELASVTSNVDHIKTIIATQQSYAQRSDMTEVVEIATLIDDALRMGEVSFSRHGIEVCKEYDEGVTVETDRHRLLEILINVVSNARHSLKLAGPKPLRLGVQLRRTVDGVSIKISDSGVGIPAENLDKVFMHGFTTKPDGHGFGLHACANAAKELGGSIAASSAGAGLGAEFTIELPLQGPKRGAHGLAA